ncbi:hypothetical protein V8D89_007913 [Ganoderma adspersum]
MSPVDLSNGNSLDQFHTFIFSNEPSRAPCIYGLKLPSQYDDPEVRDMVIGRLVAILEAAVHIQYLDFATSIGPSVFGAVAKANTNTSLLPDDSIHAVRSLKLKTGFSSDFHTLDVLLRLFPNLDKTLDLGRRLIGNVGKDEYCAFRERSKDAQKRHAWSGLDKLVCDLPTAYLLALQCPIRRMDSEVVQHM